VFFLYMRLAVNLAAGDRAAVRADAQQIAELVKEAPGVWSEIHLIDRTVEPFIRVRDPAGAQQFVSTALTAGFESNPLLWRARGRILLAEGRASEAREPLERAAGALQQARYLDEAWPARRAYADALAALGDRAGAEAEPRAVREEATAPHHRLGARQSRGELATPRITSPRRQAATR